MSRVTTTLYGNLALIPVPAETPAVESLQFLTDDFESYNGLEENIQLRTKARQVLQYKIPLQALAQADVFNTAYGAIRKKWAIPLWIEMQSVGQVNNAATFILCNTALYDFRDNSLAYLYDITGKFQVLEISTVVSDRINVSAISDFFRNAYLMPCRIGRVSGSINKKLNGLTGSLDLQFFVEDTKSLSGAMPIQYLSNDIYYEAGLLDNNEILTSIEKREDIIDFDLGVSVSRSPWINSKHSRQHNIKPATPQEIRTYKEFLYRRQGKSKLFWTPTFLNDIFCLNIGLVVSTIIANRDSYLEYAQNRIHIAIESGGVWYPRLISSPSPTSTTTMQFTIDSPLNVQASSITRISYLGLYRLDSDVIEIMYGSNLMAESSVRIKELLP